jgi:beta-glucosidase
VSFPDGFLWGAATSAFQIEGSLDADGRGPSIWDGFAGESGDTGDVACDHYRRWRADLDLLPELGLNAYRFSIAWPRVHPDGRRLEPRGLDHYDRLVDRLVELGVEPIVTLYHWDLPQALQDEGGWLARDTAQRLAEHAAVCFDAFGDRVRTWLTICEPWIVGLLGYLLGLHAPGVRDDLRGEVTAFHHLLLAHGEIVRAFRASGRDGRIGLDPNLMPHYPARGHVPADAEMAHASDGYVNRWFLDAIFRGAYPDDQRRRYEALLGPLDFVRDGDLEAIAQPIDLLGVNYYAPRWIEAAPGDAPWPWRVVVPEGLRTTGGFSEGVPRTEAGTPIFPRGLTDLLVRLRDDYGDVPILVAENGGVFDDAPGADGRVRDDRRVRFLHDHVAALQDAVDRGVPVLGYCHWSLLDNFEWALGYRQRFGLVHVDYATQRRTVKDSGRYYARVAAANALVEP